MSASPIEALLRERIGLDLATLGASALPRAVITRMAACRQTTTEDYLAFLTANLNEWDALLNELLVGETWFFRGGRALFDQLAKWIHTAATTLHRPIRIASIPCSTGEEPISLAIALHELGVPTRSYHIDGIDLSELHLARAREGISTAYAFREPLPDLQTNWFIPRGDNRWALSPRLHGIVHYRYGNIIDRNFLVGEPAYDLILCRNLFIYLTADARRVALANLDRVLAPNGILCLTAAEADLLPKSRYIPDGPSTLAIFRRSYIERDESKAAFEPTSCVTGRDHSVSSRSPSSGHFSVPSGDRRIERLDTSCNAPIAGDPNITATLDPRALADAGRMDEALVSCNRLLKSQPPTADLYSLLGILELAAGHRREAASAFRSALYLAPDHPEALRYAIVFHEQSGELDRAIALKRRLARVEEREPT